MQKTPTNIFSQQKELQAHFHCLYDSSDVQTKRIMETCGLYTKYNK